MTRTFLTLAVCLSMSTLVGREAAGGRGGGYSGGGMERGRGGGRGYEGGGMGRSPSFSQPHSQMNSSESGSRNSSQYNASSGNRNASSNNPNAGAAAAGAGYANRNDTSNRPNAAPAAAGAGYANRNDTSNHPNAAPAAAGAGYANRNQSGNYPNAGAAAAGAGYANRNQSGNYPNAGAAAAGAGYANRNNEYSNAGAAAAGAAYGSNYGSYYGGGNWNGNYGAGMGSYGGMGMASPSYGYGSMPYVNPYVSMMGSGVGGQSGGQGQPANNAPAGNSPGYDYNQPVNTAAAASPTPPPADPSTSPAAQAHQAFQAGDFANAVQLTQQALGQTPNNVDLHQFLALGLFALGNYEQAAAPLYAVLAAGPGWDWTTLIGNYADAGVYTTQLRGLEAFVRANPRSAKAQFVEAYQYICQGQGKAAIRPLRAVLAIQPNDGVSAQLLERLQPQGPASLARPVEPATLPGVWVAKAPPNATFTLTISDEASFTWAFAAPGKSPVTIAGNYTLADGVLTLAGKDTPGGPLVGKVASIDETHMSFKAVGAPSTDPGLQFAR